MTDQQKVYNALTNEQKRRFWIQHSSDPATYRMLEQQLAPLLVSKQSRAWVDLWRP
jgi:hypothetical protein